MSSRAWDRASLLPGVRKRVARLLMLVTDQNGVAEIPRERAKQGGWISIVAAYDDANGRRFQGSLRDSNPPFPVTITVTPR